MKGLPEWVEVHLTGGRHDGYTCRMDRRLLPCQTFVVPLEQIAGKAPRMVLADVYKLTWLKGGVAGYAHQARAIVELQTAAWNADSVNGG